MLVVAGGAELLGLCTCKRKLVDSFLLLSLHHRTITRMSSSRMESNRSYFVAQSLLL